MTKIKVTGESLSLEQVAEAYGLSKRDQAQIRKTVSLVKAGKPATALLSRRSNGGAKNGKNIARRDGSRQAA